MTDSRVSEPEILELSPDEVIRVVAVRPRARPQIHEPPRPAAPAPTPIVPRAISPMTPASKPMTLSLEPDEIPVRAPAPVAKPALKAQKRERSLEETMDDLRAIVGLEASESLENDDFGSTTGVRHLTVEIDKPMKTKRR